MKTMFEMLHSLGDKKCTIHVKQYRVLYPWDQEFYGIILCEIIARVNADPDFLPRTENFGVDYLGFSRLVNEECPIELLKLAFTCVRVSKWYNF